MKQVLEIDQVKFRDVSREHKVRRKDAPREITHTITLVPANYAQTLWPEIEHHLVKAVVRSKGRWNMDSLLQSISNNRGSTTGFGICYKGLQTGQLIMIVMA